MTLANWWKRASGDTPAEPKEAQPSQAKPVHYTTVDHLPPMQHPRYLAVHMADAYPRSALR